MDFAPIRLGPKIAPLIEKRIVCFFHLSALKSARSHCDCRERMDSYPEEPVNKWNQLENLLNILGNSNSLDAFSTKTNGCKLRKTESMRRVRDTNMNKNMTLKSVAADTVPLRARRFRSGGYIPKSFWP